MTLKRRGKVVRTFMLVGSAGSAISDGARGLWRSESGKKWLLPLVVFLCVSGLFLIVAASVEALAPFIYAIF